jgi:hypothetical protein
MPPRDLSPDLIVHGARLYTLDARQPWACAFAVRDGRILAVGADADILELRGPHTETLNLEGRLALPGLCDAHIHLYHYAIGLSQVRLAETASRAEALALVAQTASNVAPGVWIVGQGWNESRWGETAFPSAHDLDAVTGPDRPALLLRSDMHVAVANSAALRAAAITSASEAPPGGLIDRRPDGTPTGVLRELAIGLVTRCIPEPTAAELELALVKAIRHLHALGITAVHDQRVKDGSEGPRVLAALDRLRQRGELPLRVNCNLAAHQLGELAALGLRSGFGDDYLRLGHVKVFADGSLGSRTAWLLEPFQPVSNQDATYYGVCVTPPDQMAAEFRRAAELGFPVSVHAIGDRANRVVLDIFEEMQHSAPVTPVPHRIEHAQTLAPDDIPRLAELGITASVQPLHALDDQDTADLLLGTRTRFTYAFNSLLSAGTLLAFGSDAPVASANPFLGIHAAVARCRTGRPAAAPWNPEEAIPLPEAVLAYTYSAALAGGWSRTIGRVTPGLRADVVAVDCDWFALDAPAVLGGAIAETKVVLTLFDGRVVYSS